jgi:hypothetical protein
MKGPQPVLDDLVGTPASTSSGRADTNGHTQSTTPQTNGFSRSTAHLARSSTYLAAEINGEVHRSRSASPSTRPALLRAKSDFGPRQDHSKNDDSDSKTSAEGEWGIRHGFDTQLASEDYNHLLTEVRYSRTYRRFLTLTESRTSFSISQTKSMSQAGDQREEGYRNLLFSKNGV